MKKYRLPIVALAVIVAGIALFGAVYYTMDLSLALAGEKNVTVRLNALYEDEGAKARVGGRDASDRVKVYGEVDTSVPGTYTLEYKIGTLTVERTVNVSEKMDPELVLDGDTILVKASHFMHFEKVVEKLESM